MHAKSDAVRLLTNGRLADHIGVTSKSRCTVFSEWIKQPGASAKAVPSSDSAVVRRNFPSRTSPEFTPQ